MRVTVDLRSSGDGRYDLVTTVGKGEEFAQEVTWLAGKRLLVAATAVNAVADPDGLAHALERCDADGDEAGRLEYLKQYGQLLFQAAFGGDGWQAILRAAAERAEPSLVAAGPGEQHLEAAEGGKRPEATERSQQHPGVAGGTEEYVEIAILGSADAEHAALQALRWEALHDGRRFIAVQGTTDAAIPVGVIRLIKPAAASAFQQIEQIPRILFAVGSHLGDRDIRPGPEFAGILRGLDRSGVQARVLHGATRARLQEQLRSFKPDVLHFIGHGKWTWEEVHEVKVQLRRGPDDESGWVSARELLGLFELARHRPTMVLLSACHTAGADPRDPGEFPVSALPFAARLVAGDGAAAGVPVVVAMAGDISDTACRVFTRALAASIGEGKPLGEAVIAGRRAAFFGGPGANDQRRLPESGHWVMPAVFLDEEVSSNTPLVNTALKRAAHDRVGALDIVEGPIFCGRANFIDALEQLLDPEQPLNVLGARAPGPDFGGLRLLREMATRAVRAGVLPVLLGPFERPALLPKNLVGLAERFQQCLNNIRLGVPGLRHELQPTAALAVATRGGGLWDVAKAIRADLETLVADLDPHDPVWRRPAGHPRTILLCHRIDEWGVREDLVDMFSPQGLYRGHLPAVPVVFTVAGTVLEEEERAWSGKPWIEVLPLGRLAQDKDEAGNKVAEAARGEDVLAYLWWLLNPERKNELVYALKRSPRADWAEVLRASLMGDPIYPRDKLRGIAAVSQDYTSGEDDDNLLASYASNGPLARYASA